jgi:ABC-type bacteriocin/lantibiotic exporter with double-glycine peptidase domain
LKWLLGGATVSIVAGAFSILTSTLDPNGGSTLNVISDLASFLLVALPLSMGVAILRYRLYEIDRLISRTLSYVIITGLLAWVFIGIVVLATDVLPFSSPVAVAASTLAAAALFNPLRLRVQRLVDRRFNRARYDAEAIVTAFTMRLRDAVDLDTVRHELLTAVDGAVKPAHVSVWIRPPAPRSSG